MYPVQLRTRCDPELTAGAGQGPLNAPETEMREAEGAERALKRV